VSPLLPEEVMELEMKDVEQEGWKEEDGSLPRHIAIIMDGNGRWAQRRGLPRIAGHRAGAEATWEIVMACRQWGIEVLSLYTFSIENWKRPKSETWALMLLFEEFIQREIDELVSNDIQLRGIGRMEGLPASTQRKLREAVQRTCKNRAMVLNLALNYGGRSEIVDAVRSVLAAVKGGKLREEDLDEESFARFLYTANLPDPDLLVRTGGEMRVSNFLLYQLAYAEFWATSTFWPDFTPQDLRQAISDYQQRERRFGMIGDQRRMAKPRGKPSEVSVVLPGEGIRGGDDAP